MNFNVNDIVYCIDNNRRIGDKSSPILYNLDLDKPYEITSIYYYQIELRINNSSFLYYNERFLSEKDYFIRKRKEKIEKIKSLINNV